MAAWLQVMPDDHSDLVPLLPIPNRTVKRICADDSAGSRVKVGHRQALTAATPPDLERDRGFCFFGATNQIAYSKSPAGRYKKNRSTLCVLLFVYGWEII